MKHPINEIFYSIQGEGYWTGIPAVFIRFAGCNLRCSFCDTDFSLNYKLDSKNILNRIKKYPSDDIVITGGEPSLHDINNLIDALHHENKFVQVETNGYNYQNIRNADWITFSPKDNDLKIIHYADELKIIYTGQDLTFWEGNLYSHNYLQPCEMHGKMNIKQTINYIKKNPTWRLSLQCQKLIKIK